MDIQIKPIETKSVLSKSSHLWHSPLFFSNKGYNNVVVWATLFCFDRTFDCQVVIEKNLLVLQPHE